MTPALTADTLNRSTTAVLESARAGKVVANACSCYLRLKWDRWQPAKLGTQPAVVRFRVHNNPTKWSVNVGKKIELQVKDTGETVTGIVDKVNPDGYAFIELF